jgi:RNA polymerase sigma-70 factor, ECF subfamily
MAATDPTLLSEGLRARIFGYIQARVRSPEVAEDLVQETLVRASRALAQEDISNVEGWLFRVARNSIADHFRASKDQVEWREDKHGEAARDDAEQKEEHELQEELATYVRGVVESLAEPYRSALRLTEYEGLTQKELAEQAGITLSAAKSRVQRARAEVKRVIEQCCRIASDRYGQVTDCEPRQRGDCAC